MSRSRRIIAALAIALMGGGLVAPAAIATTPPGSFVNVVLVTPIVRAKNLEIAFTIVNDSDRSFPTTGLSMRLDRFQDGKPAQVGWPVCPFRGWGRYCQLASTEPQFTPGFRTKELRGPIAAHFTTMVSVRLRALRIGEYVATVGVLGNENVDVMPKQFAFTVTSNAALPPMIRTTKKPVVGAITGVGQPVTLPFASLEVRPERWTGAWEPFNGAELSTSPIGPTLTLAYPGIYRVRQKSLEARIYVTSSPITGNTSFGTFTTNVP